jgi:hypothetical protein
MPIGKSRPANHERDADHVTADPTLATRTLATRTLAARSELSRPPAPSSVTSAIVSMALVTARPEVRNCSNRARKATDLFAIRYTRQAPDCDNREHDCDTKKRLATNMRSQACRSLQRNSPDKSQKTSHNRKKGEGGEGVAQPAKLS